MIWFCCFCLKKLFSVLGVADRDPIFEKVGPKNGNFQGFQQKLFKTTGFQLKLLISIESLIVFHWKPAKKIKVGVILGQNLGQIRPNVVNKVKKQALSISFFHILHRKYLFKQKVVVVQTLEQKFKANIARNATFEGQLGPKFCPIWVKNGKKLIFFKNFTFVSQS